MAYTDYTREKDFMQKKAESFCAIELNEGTASYEMPVAGGTVSLANLPPDCIITNAYIHVKTVSDAVTSSTGKIGTTDGGSEVLSAANLKAAVGKVGTFTGQSLTGTGKTLYFNVAKVGGDGTAVGKVVIVVEYLEYTKKTGEYTSL